LCVGTYFLNGSEPAAFGISAQSFAGGYANNCHGHDI